MNNQLTVINQDAKLALAKTRSLLDITNKILANRPSAELINSFESFRLSLSFGHTRDVTSVAITPDGKYIISGSDDKTIKLWDISSGEEICNYLTFVDGEWLSWRPNGEYNCSAGAYQYFCFVDDNKEGLPQVVDSSHPVYKAKKKDKLLSDYKIGDKVKAPIDNETIIDW